jgi:hypothetical protein
LRTLLGNDEKVMNLRPLQKDKHISNALFCHGMKSDYEKMQYRNMGSPNKYFDNDKIGLPSINSKVHKIKKALSNRNHKLELRKKYNNLLRKQETEEADNIDDESPTKKL